MNSNIFDINTLNYKRKNNIYNTHYYINTHVVECGCVQVQLEGGRGCGQPNLS
jgi:hypothetical protein